MSGIDKIKLFLDTNIVIYLLSGDETLELFLNDKVLYISFITRLELLSFNSITKQEERQINDFLSDCVIVGINTVIENEVIRLRRKYKLKIPDGIILGTAFYHDLQLLTADKDFEKVKGVEVIHYQR